MALGMSRRGSCFKRASMQDEVAEQSMRGEMSREDTITSGFCSKFNISLTEKGVDVLGLGNIAKKRRTRQEGKKL